MSNVVANLYNLCNRLVTKRNASFDVVHVCEAETSVSQLHENILVPEVVYATDRLLNGSVVLSSKCCEFCHCLSFFVVDYK